MNRLLLLGNAVLALVLLLRLYSAPTAAAAASVVDLAPDRLQVEPERDGAGRAVALVVQLGLPLGPLAPVAGEPVDLGVELDPPVPVLVSWRNAHSLRLLPATPLPASRQWRVVFRRDLSAGYHRIRAGTIVPFATSRLQLQRVVVADADLDPEAEGPGPLPPPSLRVLFDQPVTAAAARKALWLRAVGDGREVPMQVALAGDAAAADAVLVQAAVAAVAAEVPQVVELHVAAELTAAGGDVPLGRPLVHKVAWREPLALTGLRAEDMQASDGAIELQFTHALPLPDAAAIEIAPPVPFQVRRSSGGLRLLGAFQPGSVVTVRLPAGFPGQGRHRLAQPVQRSLLLPDRRPFVEFAQGGQVLCASAKPELELRGSNVERVELALARVYPNNLVRALQRGDAEVLAPDARTPVAVAAVRNETWTQSVDLAALAVGPLRGLYRLELTHDGRSWWPQRRWLQVTDLGITWRAGRGTAAVAVRDLVKGGGVADAEVIVLTPTNQELARGRTDAHGLLQCAWAADATDRQPFVVLAQKGDDVAFASSRGEGVELNDDGLGGRPYLGEGLEAYVWPSRGIVRPGESIEVAALVRDAGGLPSPSLPLALRFVGPNGRRVAEQPLTANGSGLHSGVLPLPLDAPMGVYRAEVAAQVAGGGESAPALGAAVFRVEAFVPDRLEVEVLEVAPLRFGAPGEIKVRGRWLDGSPAAGRAVAVRIRLLPHAASFVAADGFCFDAASDAAPPGELPLVEGTLAANGEAALPFALPADAPQQTLRALLAVELQDPSGRVVRAQHEVPVLRSDFHLGLRATPERAELRLLAADGAPFAGVCAVRVRLERRSWNWRYEAVGAGRWRWRTSREATPLFEGSVDVRDGRGELALPATDAGECAVVATIDGRSVEMPLGATPARPDRLRVTGPAAAVPSGGTARLVVTAPAAGQALVTLESDVVHAATVHTLGRGDTAIEVPVPAGLRLPNLHAVVTLTRPVPQSGPDLGPAWLVGGAAIAIARPELALALQIDAPAQVRPEQAWRARLLAPGATAAVVALVDEGILRVTAHADPDPLAFLLAQRRLATDGADSGAGLLQRMQFASGTRTGGDGEDDEFAGLLAGAVDSRIRPFARFAAVALDADGRGEVEFPLDGYEGRVRAMAMVAGPVGMAAARHTTVVQAPLGVQVATPRMLAPGDRCTLLVTLRNRLAAGTVAIELQPLGALELAGPASHAVAMAVDSEFTLEVPILVRSRTSGESGAGLSVRARRGDERREVTAEFTVRTPAVSAMERIGVDLAAGGTLEVGPAWQQVEATVRLDRRPALQLLPVLQQLLEYPHGCAEQTMGKGMALLACRALLPRLLPANAPQVVEADQMVQAAIDRLLAMQTWRGGFGWWAGSDEAPFVTCWVTDFLVAAREQGFVLPERALEQALDRCRELLQASEDLGVRCSSAEVLARAGRPVQPWLDWLCTAAGSGDDRARLAAVLGRLGERQRGLQLLAPDVEVPVPASPTSDLASPLRSLALELRALLALGGETPRAPELAAALQRGLLRRAATTTQEQWQGLRALVDYYARQQPVDGEPSTTLMVDGRPEALAAGERVLTLRSGSVLAFAAGGRGHALVELRGRRTSGGRRDGGIVVTRQLVDVDTGLVVERCRRGRLYEVRLSVEASSPIEHLALADLLPGGLEPEPASPLLRPSRADGVAVADAVQRGDDRVVFCCTSLPARAELRHRVRATLPGTYADPGVEAEAMYLPSSRSASGPGEALVVEP